MRAGAWRTTRKWLAGLLAGLLFVSQIALAAQACMLSIAAGVPASSIQAMQEEGCDSMPMDAAACRVRCLSQDQSAASPDQPLQAVAISPPVQHVAIATPATACPSRFASAARLPGGPPLRILHCSYQI